jgi:hypothetical protein
MKFSRFKIAYTALNIALFISVLFIGLTSSQPSYDPWLDVTDDGYGGIDDIVNTAQHFGASGDPVKLCNITNWPVSTDVGVWYTQFLTTSMTIPSDIYEASGFGHLHVLAMGLSLTSGETLRVTIYGRLANPGHTTYSNIPIYTFTLTLASYLKYVTIPVPSENFYFTASTDGMTDGYVYLSFYLTWA